VSGAFAFIYSLLNLFVRVRLNILLILQKVRKAIFLLAYFKYNDEVKNAG